MNQLSKESWFARSFNKKNIHNKKTKNHSIPTHVFTSPEKHGILLFVSLKAKETHWSSGRYIGHRAFHEVSSVQNTSSNSSFETDGGNDEVLDDQQKRCEILKHKTSVVSQGKSATVPSFFRQVPRSETSCWDVLILSLQGFPELKKNMFLHLFLQSILLPRICGFFPVVLMTVIVFCGSRRLAVEKRD